MIHSMDAAAIDLDRLEYAWSGHRPLLSIRQLRVERGERVILTGPSGSGKSTLLGLIGGVLKPRSGSVRVIGTTVSALSASQSDRFRGDHIGYIFQAFNLLPYLTVQANVTLPLRFSPLRRQRLAGEAADHVALRLLEALGLAAPNLLARPAYQLSVGQQQRVAAARALLGSPELLVADEPTSALDADARADFLGLLMGECARLGTTLLFVSHDRTLTSLFDRTVELPRINAAATAAA
jgi:putative ABC transport system ATP-binding protein